MRGKTTGSGNGGQGSRGRAARHAGSDFAEATLSLIYLVFDRPFNKSTKNNTRNVGAFIRKVASAKTLHVGQLHSLDLKCLNHGPAAQ